MSHSLRNSIPCCNSDCFQKDFCQPLCLTLTKTVDNPNPTQGDNVTFTITINNLRCKAIKNVTITDFLPNGFTYVSSSPASIVNGQVVIFNLNKLPRGITTLTITAKAILPGPFTNIVTLTFNNCPLIQPLIAEASVIVKPLSPVLTITKNGPPIPLIFGQIVTFTITLNNTGSLNGDNIIVTDQIPPGLTFQFATSPCTFDPMTNTVICNIGTLTPGQSVIITIDLTVNANIISSYANTANLTYFINGIPFTGSVTFTSP